MNLDFNKLIDNHLKKEFKPKKLGRYYPSEIGGCLRKTWFSYKNPKETDADAIKIFESGNLLHEFVTKVLQSEKNSEVELLKSEMPIQIKMKDFTISGRIDNLILIKLCDDGKCQEVLVEVKSTKFLPKEYKAEHEMQLQLYMRATGIEKGIILYIQKDNLKTISFEIDYNLNLSDKIIERFEKLHESLVSGEMPEAEAKQDKEKEWLCDYCAWREECDGKK